MHISRYTMFLFIIFTLSFSETKAQQVNFISLAKKAQFLTAFSKGILGITQSALTKNTGPLAKNLRTGAHVARIANSILDAINYHQSERSSALTTSIMQQKYNAFWLSYDSLALYNHLFATQESGGDDEEIITILNEIDPSWQSHLKKTCALFLPLAESTLACLVAYNNSNLKTSEESLMMLRALESAIRSLDVFLTAPAYSSKMQLFGALLAVSLIDAIFKPFIATTSQQNPTPQKPSSTGSTTPKTQQSPQSTPTTPRSEEPQSTATETAPAQAPVDEFLAQALQRSALHAEQRRIEDSEFQAVEEMRACLDGLYADRLKLESHLIDLEHAEPTASIIGDQEETLYQLGVITNKLGIIRRRTETGLATHTDQNTHHLMIFARYRTLENFHNAAERAHEASLALKRIEHHQVRLQQEFDAAHLAIEQAIRDRQERDRQNLADFDDTVEALSLIVTTPEEVIDHSASSTDTLSSPSSAQLPTSEVTSPLEHTFGRNHFAVLTEGFPTIESYFKN